MTRQSIGSAAGASGGGNVVVEAYAGYKGEETPRSFLYEGVRYGVRAVVARWYTERHSVFKVLADDEHRYVLRHDPDELVWELVMREEMRRPR
ncbi:MAG: hypothetical protein AB1411_08085 [Nitrospirota bacterium]